MKDTVRVRNHRKPQPAKVQAQTGGYTDPEFTLYHHLAKLRPVQQQRQLNDLLGCVRLLEKLWMFSDAGQSMARSFLALSNNDQSAFLVHARNDLLACREIICGDVPSENH